MAERPGTAVLEELLSSYDVTPSRPPALGELADVAYAVVDAPIGPLVVAAGPRGVVACSFRPEAEVTARLARVVSPRVVRAPGRLDGVRRELDEYFEGRRRSFDLPVDLALATPWQRSVLGALGEVGFGERTTYGAVAAAVGRPSASRAVGAALGANPVCVLLPCHRVVAGSGDLTGYAGGLEVKRWLLELESPAAPRPPTH